MDLNILWFFLLGVLLAGYAVLDGFDFGVGSLHLVVAKTDDERRILLNSIGPVWDGNEVWLVTFGGALFAAFPKAYAAAFSGYYLAFMLLLVALIFRAVAIEFRSKREARWWRLLWDVSFFAASALSALLFGTAIGSILRGIPLAADGEFGGSFFDIVTPYSLLVGVFTLALFVLHGGVYLFGKTEGELRSRVRRAIWSVTGVCFALYVLTTIITITSNPQATANFGRYPWAWVIVVLNVAALANIPREVFHDHPRRAFISSAVAIMCLVALFGLAEFPNLMTSSIETATRSLTIYNAASSQKTLSIMRLIAFLGMPFVVTYTAVIYWVFRGKVKIGKHSY